MKFDRVKHIQRNCIKKHIAQIDQIVQQIHFSK